MEAQDTVEKQSTGFSNMHLSLRRTLFILSMAALVVAAAFTPALAAINEVVWKKFLTSDAVDSYSMDVDGNGNIIVALATENTPLTLSKLSGGGNELWTRQVTTDWESSAEDIAVDSDGFIYLAGSRGEGYPNSLGTASISKYGPKGGHHWTKIIADASILRVDVGPGGNIVVLGYFVEYANFPPTSGKDISFTFFIRKYNTRGKVYWTRRFMAAGFKNGAQLFDLAIGPGGGIYMTGVQDSLDYWDRPLFLLKYSPQGDASWRRDIQRKESYRASDANIVVDRRGEATIALRSGDSEAVTIKYTHKGKRVWTRVSSNLRPQGLAVDSDRSIYVLGVGKRGAFARKYEADGDRMWTRYFSNYSVRDAAADSDNNLYVSVWPGLLVKFRR